MTEPRPVVAGLAGARDALARGAAAAAKVPGLDLDDVEEHTGRTMADLRQVRWEQAVPSRFAWAEVGDFTGSAGEALTDWVCAKPHPNLVVVGPTGVGKTHAAAAATRELYQGAGLEPVFHPTDELIDRLDWRRPDSHQVLEEAMHADVLVLDDLAANPLSDWAAARIYVVVNRRWMDERPTVATTNVSPVPEGTKPSALESALGQRTYSRLVGSSAVVVRLSGKDRRRSG